MPTAALEARLDFWLTGPWDAKDQIRPLLAARGVIRSASAVLDGLLGESGAATRRARSPLRFRRWRGRRRSGRGGTRRRRI
ncbi:hypothetical protein [Methylobacterium terricola]|uniref:hypothetical protein n=1 Tax=Methylobacterium terricola TaxID=2583531 RepID=UPI0014875020|nr:hypothetical protein [Methylobacterium terricola]